MLMLRENYPMIETQETIAESLEVISIPTNYTDLELII